MVDIPNERDSAQTWCKICGITTAADALAVEQAGADAMGFMCYEPSPRHIPLPDLVEISAAVAITRVAVFVDAPVSEVEAVIGTADIDLLQFHGDEEEAYCRSFGLPYMKVLRMRADADPLAHARHYESAWALMLETYVPGVHGGTGESFDWSRWPQMSEQRLVLAGGLDVASVGAAIRTLHPFGVDVSTGVEGPVKGRKDHLKIAEFVQEVRRVGRE